MRVESVFFLEFSRYMEFFFHSIACRTTQTRTLDIKTPSTCRTDTIIIEINLSMIEPCIIDTLYDRWPQCFSPFVRIILTRLHFFQTFGIYRLCEFHLCHCRAMEELIHTIYYGYVCLCICSYYATRTHIIMADYLFSICSSGTFCARFFRFTDDAAN